jgi:type VII secretion protein EccE
MTMNEPPSRVRAVARISAEPAAAASRPVTFLRRRRHGYLGPVNVLQLVLIEVLIIGILLLLGQSMYALIGGVVLSVAIVVITFARSGGRWWVERMLLRRQYLRRKTGRQLAADDKRLVALRRLVPDLTVRSVEGPNGIDVGIGRDGAGSFAVVAVVPPQGVNGDALGQMPLTKLASLAQDAEQPGAVVQVVRHTLPVRGGGAAGESYRELVAKFGLTSAADQATWVAVRFDARAVAEASVGGADESEQVPVMLGALVRRVGKALRRAGLDFQVLNSDGLLDALTRSCELSQSAAGGPTPAVKERWTAWQSTSLAHACFWVSSWPGLRDSGPFLDAMSRVPAALTSLSVVLAPYEELIEVRCLLRVAAEPELLAQTCTAVKQAVSRAGGNVFRLDGEQAPAVYATAPTGGGAR